jgi:uncharacterized protein
MTMQNQLPDTSIDDIISALQLLPHPEGGFYSETYRSRGTIDKKNLDEQYSGNRNYSTCIYFLLTATSFSAFHRILQDEIWHFYDGYPLTIYMLDRVQGCREITLGKDMKNGQLPQYVVPGGTWFAARVKEQGRYTLAGCTVAPGFDFADFLMASRSELLSIFPQYRILIMELARD